MTHTYPSSAGLGGNPVLEVAPVHARQESAATRRGRIISLLAVFIILAISAAIQFIVVTRTVIPRPIRADAAAYFSYAYNLKHSGVYSAQPTWRTPEKVQTVLPDAVSTPGYPLFLLLVPRLEPTDGYVMRVLLVQAALGVVSVLLVFLIAGTFLRPGWTHAVALLTAISPHLATISTYLLTESLFLFLVLASVWMSLVAMATPTRWKLLGAGLLWGACSLVRPTVQFLPVLFVLAALALPRFRQYRHAAVLVFVGFLVVQAPWQIRNNTTQFAANQPSLTAKFLHHGSYPEFMYQNRPETYGFPYDADPDSERLSRDVSSALANIARHFRDDPLTYAHWYLIGKPGAFLSWGIINGYGDIYTYPPRHTPYREDSRFQAIRVVALILHWPLMLLGLGGAMAAWWRPRLFASGDRAIFAARIVSAIVLYAIAFHMIGAPFPRYAIPFRPLVYMLALALVSVPWLRRAEKRAGGACA
jgi:4-amino-4-deoxy-L-arabinose transferase-like glycosyltransferase